MSVESRVIKIIAEEFGREDSSISPDHAFKEDLGADSLRLYQLMIALQEEFEIEEDPPEEDFLRIKKVGDVVDYIGKLLGPVRAGKF